MELGREIQGGLPGASDPEQQMKESWDLDHGSSHGTPLLSSSIHSFIQGHWFSVVSAAYKTKMNTQCSQGRKRC